MIGLTFGVAIHFIFFCSLHINYFKPRLSIDFFYPSFLYIFPSLELFPNLCVHSNLTNSNEGLY